MMNFTIRQEDAKDYELTEKVVQRAFVDAEYSDKREHKLVSRIRKSNALIPELSLVAVDANEKIVGHILLSKIKIKNSEQNIESLALAPVSVLPDYQNRGIGRQLIFEALKRAKELEYQSVIVLGHPKYYPKFGFRKASELEINAPFDVPDEAFMVIELKEKALQRFSGTVEYPNVFLE